MRKVRTDEKPPEGWLQEADAATQELRQAENAVERAAVIDKHEKLWRDPRIKEWLLKQFHDKCWYSEARETVSAYQTDHFRPKGRTADDLAKGKYEEGYWWLAFDWKNYRMSGQLLNVKKKDVFPMAQGPRATADNFHHLDTEAPVLLDPCTEDASLVSYERDEEACVAVPAVLIGQEEVKRAERSIEILGLNRLRVLNEGRARAWDNCLRHVRDYEGAKDTRNAPALSKVMKAVAIRELRLLITYEAEFSMVSHACIEKQSPDEALRRAVFS